MTTSNRNDDQTLDQLIRAAVPAAPNPERESALVERVTSQIDAAGGSRMPARSRRRRLSGWPRIAVPAVAVAGALLAVVAMWPRTDDSSFAGFTLAEVYADSVRAVDGPWEDTRVFVDRVTSTDAGDNWTHILVKHDDVGAPYVASASDGKDSPLEPCTKPATALGCVPPPALETTAPLIADDSIDDVETLRTRVDALARKLDRKRTRPDNDQLVVLEPDAEGKVGADLQVYIGKVQMVRTLLAYSDRREARAAAWRWLQRYGGGTLTGEREDARARRGVAIRFPEDRWRSVLSAPVEVQSSTTGEQLTTQAYLGWMHERGTTELIVDPRTGAILQASTLWQRQPTAATLIDPLHPLWSQEYLQAQRDSIPTIGGGDEEYERTVYR